MMKIHQNCQILSSTRSCDSPAFFVLVDKKDYFLFVSSSVYRSAMAMKIKKHTKPDVEFDDDTDDSDDDALEIFR
jgi:signal recognition particle receptor subunit beta